MKPFFKAAISANKEIIELIRSGSSSDFRMSISLGAGGDISSKIDLLAESIFVKHLSHFGNICSEECGFIDNQKDDEVVIDPIDGSDNFASNLPYYGTSVALKKDNIVVYAVIVNLTNGEVFLKDETGFCRGNIENLKFKKVEKNHFSKLGIFEKTYCSKGTPEKMRENRIKYRSPGAFALSLAYAHDVNFVLYEGKMREYDIAAGLYMCEDLYIEKREDLLLVSQNKEIFDKILQFI